MKKTVVIANGASLSGALDMGGAREIVGIEMPSAWTAAALTFQVSTDGVTYQNLFGDGGTEVQFTVATSQNIALRQDACSLLSKWCFFKLRSGTPVNQAADRTIGVYGR